MWFTDRHKDLTRIVTQPTSNWQNDTLNNLGGQPLTNRFHFTFLMELPHFVLLLLIDTHMMMYNRAIWWVLLGQIHWFDAMVLPLWDGKHTENGLVGSYGLCLGCGGGWGLCLGFWQEILMSIIPSILGCWHSWMCVPQNCTKSGHVLPFRFHGNCHQVPLVSGAMPMTTWCLELR